MTEFPSPHVIPGLRPRCRARFAREAERGLRYAGRTEVVRAEKRRVQVPLGGVRRVTHSIGVVEIVATSFSNRIIFAILLTFSDNGPNSLLLDEREV